MPPKGLASRPKLSEELFTVLAQKLDTDLVAHSWPARLPGPFPLHADKAGPGPGRPRP